MKNAKDYLHFYLGCECKVNGVDEKFILTGISYDDTVKTHWAYSENTELGYAPVDELKPILRPLSDMTEEENKEAMKMYYVDDIELLPWFSKQHFELTRWLLSKHFDIFGLITDEIALDKTTFKPLQHENSAGNN